MIYLLAMLLPVVLMPVVSFADSLVERGRYISQLANCYACHTDSENEGEAFAGNRTLETEFGTFYSPNITPDRGTGIGSWTDQEFSDAVRSGMSPDGSHYYPVFPYGSYQNITDQDIKALKAYLFSLKPVNQKNTPHKLKWYLSRFSIGVWKMLNNSMQQAGESSAERGSYLIDTLGHCNECHTPRNSLGMLKMDQKFTGNEDLSAPDISASNLKGWRSEELNDFFSDGVLPNGDYVSDHMAEVVEFSTSNWKPADLKAAIRYLTKQ